MKYKSIIGRHLDQIHITKRRSCNGKSLVSVFGKYSNKSFSDNRRSLSGWLRPMSLAKTAAPILLFAGYSTFFIGGQSLPAVAATQQTINTFAATATLPSGLIGATSTLLDNGDVLIAGGNTGSASSPSATSAAEIYDPATGTFVATSAMPVAAYDSTATLLDNGNVLVAGGISSSGTALSNAEIYNTGTGDWTQVSPMTTASFDASASILGNGEVLIAGGQTGSMSSVTTTTTSSTSTTTTSSTSTTTTMAPVTSYSATSSAELFDPSTNSFLAAASLSTPLADTTATLLGNGDVLIAGGLTGIGSNEVPSNVADVFVPPPSGQSSPGTMTQVGNLPVPLAAASADRLANGDVLIAGGEESINNVLTASNGAYLYNPATSAFVSTSQLAIGHADAPMTQLPNGNILIAGGLTGSITSETPTGTAEIYDTATNTWMQTASLVTARADTSAVLLAGGYVLIAGGQGANGVSLNSAELYFAGIQPAFTSVGRGIFVAGRAHSVLITASGTPAPTFTESGSLPAGLTFSNVTGGKAEISGTPASGSEGTYNLIITANNGTSGTPSQNYTLSVRYPAVEGYLEVGAQGQIYSYGAAKSMSNLSLNPRVRPVVAISETADAKGYYVVTNRGNIFNFGDAKFHGSHAKSRLPHPIVAFQTVDNGSGYYLVTSGGNIFNYGTAQFYGSTAHINLSSPVTSMAVTPNGQGYWLVTASGSVYPFGNAVGYSHLSVNPKVRKIVAILPDATGQGYWLVSRLGNVYNYGNAQFFGSKAKYRLPAAIVGAQANINGKGYVLISSRGNTYNFGSVHFYGSPAHIKIPVRIAAGSLAY